MKETVRNTKSTTFLHMPLSRSRLYRTIDHYMLKIPNFQLVLWSCCSTARLPRTSRNPKTKLIRSPVAGYSSKEHSVHRASGHTVRATRIDQYRAIIDSTIGDALSVRENISDLKRFVLFQLIISPTNGRGKGVLFIFFFFFFCDTRRASEMSTKVSAPLFVDAPSLIIDNGPTPYSTSTEHSRDNFFKRVLTRDCAFVA